MLSPNSSIPFGQSSTASPFTSQFGLGQTNSANTNAFAPKPFGSPGIFGSQFGASSPAFGSSTSSMLSFGSSSSLGGSTQCGQNASFGSFGSTTIGSTLQQTTPTFGSHTFGSTKPFSALNQNAFGSTGSTNSPAFGATTTSFLGGTGTAFGVPSSTSFGSTSTSAFGAQSTSLFGTSTSPSFAMASPTLAGSSTLFNASTPPFGMTFGTTSSAFGTQNSTNGVQTANFTFGIPGSGQTTSGGQQGGSRMAKHTPTLTIEDKNNKQSNIYLQSISGMSVYKDKSHEELRWEDYQRGDKGGPNYAGQSGAAVNFPSSEKANPFRLTSSNSSSNQTSPFSSVAQNSVNPSFNCTNTFSTPGLSSSNSSSNQTTTFSSFAQNSANPSFNFTNTFATPGLTCANPFPQTSSNSLSNQTPTFSQFTQNNANPSFNHTPTFTTPGLTRANPSAQTSSNSLSNQTPTFSQFQQDSANTSFNFKPTFSTSGQTSANPFAQTSSNSSFNQTSSFPFSKGANPGGQTSAKPFATAVISSSNSVSCLPFSTLPSSFSSTSSTLNGVSTTSSPFDTSSTPSITQATSPNFPYFVASRSSQFTTPPSSFSSISSSSITTSTPFTTSLQFPMTSQWNSGQTNPSTSPASQVASAAQTSSYVIPTHPASSTANCEFKAPQGLFAQLPNTMCNMVTEPVSTANPWGTLPAPPRIFSGQRGSEHVQYGISSMPVAEKSTPTKTSSLSALRHLSQRRISLPLRKYNAKVDGPKVPFFMEDEGQQTSSGADTFFKPRENPRSFVIRQSEQWPSRGSIENQSIPTNENESPAGNNCTREKKLNSSTNGHFHKLTDSSYINFKVYEHRDDIDTLMPKLPNTEYYTEPRIPELAAKERQEPGFCCHVKDFVIGRHGYGSIKFDGETDVRNLDLESIVQFNDREVIVYKDDNMKPPVGEGLNKPAEVTLLNIKCVDKKTGERYTEGIKVEKFKEKLMKKTEEQKAEFVSFDAVEGFWKFRVKHF